MMKYGRHERDELQLDAAQDGLNLTMYGRPAMPHRWPICGLLTEPDKRRR